MSQRGDTPGAPPPTTAQLRDDIDAGRTGDKVQWSDPAAAPLGTDDEAVGTPPAPAAIAAARRHESRPVQSDSLARGAGPLPSGTIVPVLAVIAVMVVLAAVAIALT